VTIEVDVVGVHNFTPKKNKTLYLYPNIKFVIICFVFFVFGINEILGA